MKIWIFAMGLTIVLTLEAMDGDNDSKHAIRESQKTCSNCIQSVQEWLPHIVKYRIRRGIDLNQPIRSSCVHTDIIDNLDNEPPLLISSSSDNFLRITKKLLRHHADPNSKVPKWDGSPLLKAISNGATRTVKALLKAGADPNIRGHQNTPILHLACFHARAKSCTNSASNMKGYIRNVKLLLQYGANPNQLNNFRTTPVLELIFGGAHWLGGKRILPILQELLLFGADPNLKKPVSHENYRIAQFLKDWQEGKAKFKKKKLR